MMMMMMMMKKKKKKKNKKKKKKKKKTKKKNKKNKTKKKNKKNKKKKKKKKKKNKNQIRSYVQFNIISTIIIVIIKLLGTSLCKVQVCHFFKNRSTLCQSNIASGLIVIILKRFL